MLYYLHHLDNPQEVSEMQVKEIISDSFSRPDTRE